MPRRIQIYLRRHAVNLQRKQNKSNWSIDEKSARLPDGWGGWPEKKKFALILTHDVDTGRGQERCCQLMQLEKKIGFRSSFNFVPERYKVSKTLLERLTQCGFEVGVHGLVHDGKLYNSKKIFLKRALKINHYLKKWDSVGFRSPAMHHNLDWIHHLQIQYDASTFDTDPFEPQSNGVRTIFPFWCSQNSDKQGYVELPYTLPQDFTLFVLLEEKNINIWEKKLDWIVENGGMALLNTHPDYMNFNKSKIKYDEYSAELYLQFLEHIKSKYEGLYWHVLPKEVSKFVRQCANQ